MAPAVGRASPPGADVSPRQLVVTLSQGLVRFPLSMRVAFCLAMFLSGAALVVPLLKTSSVAYTFLNVSVNSGAPRGNGPANGQAIYFPHHPPPANAQCRYLSGGIQTLSELYSNTKRACDMLDSDGDYTRGSWVQTCALEPSTILGKQLEYANYAKNYVPTARHDACYVTADPSVIELKTRGLMYTYQPDDCALVSFSSMILAEMMRRNRFYFVGDSLTEQFVHSISALTGTSPHFNKSYILVNHKTLSPMSGDEWLRCMDSERKRMAKRLRHATEKTLNQLTNAESKHGVCGDLADPYLFCMAETIRAEPHDEWALPELPSVCPTDTYRYSEKAAPKFAKQYHRSLMYQEWPQHLDGVDVLVLGTGHHWWKEEEIALLQQTKRREGATDRPFALYNDMIRGVFSYLKTHFKGKHIVFLAATAGHYNCQNIKEVLAPSEESTQDVYNWHKPLEAQQALADIAAEVGIADKLVVLNFTMTAARSDHHPGKDCLHWCEPGIPDTEAHLFYNLLLQLGYADNIPWP